MTLDAHAGSPDLDLKRKFGTARRCYTCPSATVPWHSNLFEGMWLFLIVAAILAALVLCFVPGVSRMTAQDRWAVLLLWIGAVLILAVCVGFVAHLHLKPERNPEMTIPDHAIT